MQVSFCVEAYRDFVLEDIENCLKTQMKTGIGIRLNVNLESLIPVGDSVPDRVIREPFGIAIADDVIDG